MASAASPSAKSASLAAARASSCAARLSILAWRSSILAAASAFICDHLLRALAPASAACCWVSLTAWLMSAWAWSIRCLSWSRDSVAAACAADLASAACCWSSSSCAEKSMGPPWVAWIAGLAASKRSSPLTPMRGVDGQHQGVGFALTEEHRYLDRTGPRQATPPPRRRLHRRPRRELGGVFDHLRHPGSAGYGSADDEDRLARPAVLPAAFVGASPVGQREGLAHHRLELAVVDQSREMLEFATVWSHDEEHPWTPYLSASSRVGGAPRVTSRPPARSTP